MYAVNHPIFVFSCFLIPLFGLLLQDNLSQRIILWILYACVFLLLPAFTGYIYVFNSAYEVLIYIAVMCLYAWLITFTKRQISVTATFSAVLFLICGFTAFIGIMTGRVNIQQQWNVKNYRIQYIHNQGFSGRARMSYQLSKYAILPIFVKDVDSRLDTDTTGSCWVKFDDERFIFNKCDPDSSYSSPKKSK